MATARTIRTVSPNPSSEASSRRVRRRSLLSRLRAIKWKRTYQWIGFHHTIMLVVIFAAAVTAILIAGCGSSHIGHRVFLVNLHYLNSKEPPSASPGAWENITLPAFEVIKNTHLTVRVGYFGLCAKDDRGGWVCRGNAADLIATRRFEDPLGITTMANKLKDDVFFPGLLLGSTGLAIVAFILFSFFPNWKDETDDETGSEVEVKNFPSQKLLHSCLACSGLATLFMFTSALWQHTSAAAAATVLETSAVSVVKASVGAVGTVLVWLGFGLWLIAFLCVVAMVLSIAILDRLMDD